MNTLTVPNHKYNRDDVVLVKDSRGVSFACYRVKDKDGKTVYLDKALEDLRKTK